MSSRLIRPAFLTAGIVAAFVAPARAQFVGDFLLEGDSTYFGPGDGREFAQWSVESVMDGVGYTEGAIWTDNLPNSFQIQANAESTAEGTTPVRLTTTASVIAATAGTLSFTVSFNAQGNQTGGFYYTVWPDSTPVNSPVYTADQSFSISLLAGDGFAFNVFAEDLSSALGDHDFFSATISNFSFTPVPEPSSAAALVGLGALGAVALRRRRVSR